MNCGGHGRWSLLSMTPMVLLVLGLHLQGSASRCIDTVLGQDLQPLPPGVQRCSLPSGLLQPDVLPPGQGGGSSDGGGSRIVGGSPAVSGSYGGGSSGVGPTPQGGGPFQFGRPGKQWQWPNGRPIGPIIAGGSSQSGGPLGSGPSGSGSPPYGAGPVGAGRPGGSAQWGYPGQYGGGPGGYSSGYDGGYGRPGYIRPVAKPPSIPYIPSAREWGGGRIPLPRDSPPLNPNAPYLGPYGGGAGSYGGGAGSYSGGAGSYNNPGRPYPPSTYSGESGASGPRGRDDGSYGPEPIRMTPGSQSNTPLDRESPCKPTC